MNLIHFLFLWPILFRNNGEFAIIDDRLNLNGPVELITRLIIIHVLV